MKELFLSILVNMAYKLVGEEELFNYVVKKLFPGKIIAITMADSEEELGYKLGESFVNSDEYAAEDEVVSDEPKKSLLQ